MPIGPMMSGESPAAMRVARVSDASVLSTTVSFSEAGDYVLHVTANDYSGNGGGGTVCCWTTAMIKVSVSANPVHTTGQ